MNSDRHFDSGDDDRHDDDAHFIDGIFNYCDRWCERCAYTHRCRSFALGIEIEEQVEREEQEQQRRNEEFWRSMESILGHTLEVIDEQLATVDATRQQTPPIEETQSTEDDNEATAAAPRWQSRLRERAQHPLAAASLEYATRCETWFNDSEATIGRKQEEINARLAAGEDSAALIAETTRITDALEVIQWHMLQIHVKIMRSLSAFRDSWNDLVDEAEEAGEIPDAGITGDDDPLAGLELDWDDDDDEEWEEDPIQNDRNGSAKVALVGIDRSIAAWGILWESLRGESDRILPILVGLAQLRRDVEAEFPDARVFKRPGFDT